MKLIKLFLALAAFVLPCFAVTVQAQTTVRMLIGYPPGGELEIIARAFSEKLAEAIDRPVVVESRSGAAGRIAATALKAAAPDGNTLMLAPDTVVTLNPHTVKAPAYDTLRDFVLIAHVGTFDYGLAVGANVPAKDFREWVQWVKADNKNAAYGSMGTGGSTHLFGSMLGQAIGVPLVNVPYRGVMPALAELLGGQLAATILSLSSLARQAKSGKIRVLAHSGSRRSSLAPEVPTFKELGYAALEISGWYGIFAPAGMRPELVARYNEVFNQAQRSAAVRERMGKLDLEFLELTPAELAAKVTAEYRRWGQVVKASGFSVGDQ